MYGNDYPNSYDSTGMGGSGTDNTNYGQTSNTYHYESSGSFSGGDGFRREPYQPDAGKKKKKEHKNSSGAGKKIALGICCGLFFGVFAGLGFQAVDTAADFLKDKTGSTEVGQKQEAGTSLGLEENRIGEALSDGQSADSQNFLYEENTKVNGTQMMQTTLTDVTEVVKEVMPCMVSVNKRYIETMSFWGQQYSQEGTGSGSGFIVGKNETELLLVSNYHVVESPEELTVQFVDGSQAQAQIKGMDADKDLAVLAVQLSDIDSETMGQIAIAKLGSSDNLNLGEPVVAIGNALGYGQSVTTGVVSALNRPIAASSPLDTVTQSDKEINTFIQTNAAINPGNSGGALLNIKGEVIGITSNKIGGEAVEGMGYAIPISDVQPIIEHLMSKETKLKVDEKKQGYLGITGINVEPQYTELYDAPEGVYVSSVTEGSGADKAGLVRGDIIVAIDDEEISSMEELKDYLSYCEAGSTVTLTIMQGSPTGYRSKTVEVKLGSQSSIQ